MVPTVGCGRGRGGGLVLPVQERQTKLAVFSPRPRWPGHHLGAWSSMGSQVG